MNFNQSEIVKEISHNSTLSMPNYPREGGRERETEGEGENE